MKTKIVMLLLGVVLLMGCSSSQDNATATDSGRTSEATTGENAENTSEDWIEEDEWVSDEEDASVNDGMLDNNEMPENESSNPQEAEKYIQTYYYDTETLTFTESIAQLADLVQQFNGYVESSSITGSPLLRDEPGDRRGDYVIRIPMDEMDAFREEIEEGDILHIRDARSEKENVTNQYMDISARLKTLQLQEERLLAILEEADELEYILELERELSDVRYDIERYTSSIRQLDNKINYITIHMSIREVYEVTPREEEPRTFTERLNTGFSHSIHEVKTFFVDKTLWIMTRSPLIITYLILFGILFIIGLRLWKRILKKIKKSDKDNLS